MSASAYFQKRLLPAQADAEEFGWLQIAGRLQAPALLGRTRLDNDHDVLVYEDVFASGRCRLLLGDLIALADHGRISTAEVAHLIDAVCDDLIAQTSATGRPAPLSACVPALYADRIRPGGRVDAWYNDELSLTDPRTGEHVPLRELTGYTVTVNDGPPLLLDLPAAIGSARTALHPDSQWISAVTQGDPTEPNIATSAVGACWLDFEYAGRNTLAGEIANFLWYLLALGGWLVPTYQPDVYARTMHHHLPAAATPTAVQATLSVRHRRLDLHHRWPTSPGRRTALARLLARITTDLGDAAGLPAHQQLHAITPFLTLRILGVIPPHLLTPADLLLLTAKLTQAQHLQNPTPFTHTDPLPALAPVETP
ncbi:hypothetical protein ACIA98_42455 [Streptomyces sp. NPDC051366]|uniref:hypothetical protein n=1 Tax=Streptomyces sp. NPDC051366 TaxID=3365652 RepID=UPI0037A0E0B1